MKEKDLECMPSLGYRPRENPVTDRGGKPLPIRSPPFLGFL